MIKLTSQTKDTLVGKTIKSVDYDDHYTSITITFTDESTLEITGVDCFDLVVEVTPSLSSNHNDGIEVENE
jgi:hypothetical protein